MNPLHIYTTTNSDNTSTTTTTTTTTSNSSNSGNGNSSNNTNTSNGNGKTTLVKDTRYYLSDGSVFSLFGSHKYLSLLRSPFSLYTTPTTPPDSFVFFSSRVFMM